MKTIAIVGNPNCGKTVLFNALTGSRQKVGNWSGVTVERKQGVLSLAGDDYQIIDLPGVYSLSVTDQATSQDEKIACEFILSGKVDGVINVLDASNLQRNLYVTAQLLEMGIPVIIVLNMMDIAKRRGLKIDHQQLSQQLSCPVLPLIANKNKGISELKQYLQQPIPKPANIDYAINPAVKTASHQLQQMLQAVGDQKNHDYLARRLLENDALALANVPTAIAEQAQQCRQTIYQSECQDAELLIADARYAWLQNLTEKVTINKINHKKTVTERIDQVLLNRFLGIPIFLLVMYLIFLIAINVGGAFQDFFDIGSTTIFIDGLSQLLMWLHVPTWLTALLANGLGKGINTVVTFAPVIGGMFLCLSFLEDSGYMARAAFVVDRLMRAIGLPGKAFVPLIVGFGCNVPTVMAARTLPNERDRIVTIMMAPFMSCGARLAIYAVFVSAFFPQGGQNIIFLLYLIGILVAIITGFLLRFTLLKGNSAPMLIELPTYHKPHLGAILRNTWQRLKMFLYKAGRFIIPICIVLGCLNSIGTNGKLLTGEANQQSVLSSVAKSITPVFSPMGIQQDNWPATVGLISGLLAKEVVVGSLNTLYVQIGHLSAEKQQFDFVDGLKQAVVSIPENLVALPQALSNPVMASAAPHDVTDGVYGVMYRYFDGKKGAFAFLLFILLYFPCVSTMAVMRREISKKWATFSMIWTTGLAYSIATLFYQVSTFSRYPITASAWIIAITLLLSASVVYLRIKTRDAGKTHNTNQRIIPIYPVK